MILIFSRETNIKVMTNMYQPLTKYDMQLGTPKLCLDHIDLVAYHATEQQENEVDNNNDANVSQGDN